MAGITGLVQTLSFYAQSINNEIATPFLLQRRFLFCLLLLQYFLLPVFFVSLVNVSCSLDGAVGLPFKCIEMCC